MLPPRPDTGTGWRLTFPPVLPAWRGDELPEGAINLKNDGGTAAFQGAAPPPGHGPHRYIFTVHALDSRLDLDGEARPAVAHFMARGHILGRGMLIGTWENAR